MSLQERFWRKNRRQIGGSSCKGVDLNRNYGYKWMASNNVIYIFLRRFSIINFRFFFLSVLRRNIFWASTIFRARDHCHQKRLEQIQKKYQSVFISAFLWRLGFISVGL